jgi:hypothetical protein
MVLPANAPSKSESASSAAGPAPPRRVGDRAGLGEEVPERIGLLAVHGDPPGLIAELPGGRLQPFGVAPADGDLGPQAGQQPGGLQSDARAAAEHRHVPVFHAHRRSSLFSERLVR